MKLRVKVSKETVVLRRNDEGLTLETSALYSLRWPIYIFNLVDITKLSEISWLSVLTTTMACEISLGNKDFTKLKMT